jgi:hypothetical protein
VIDLLICHCGLTIACRPPRITTAHICIYTVRLCELQFRTTCVGTNNENTYTAVLLSVCVLERGMMTTKRGREMYMHAWPLLKHKGRVSCYLPTREPAKTSPPVPSTRLTHKTLVVFVFASTSERMLWIMARSHVSQSAYFSWFFGRTCTCCGGVFLRL